MKLLKFALLLCVSISGFYSCDSVESKPNQNLENIIIPLQVGNKWTYEFDEIIYVLDTTNHITDFDLEVTEEISVSKNGNNTNCFKYNYMFINYGPQHSSWYYANSDSGLVVHGSDEPYYSSMPSGLRIKYPASIGDTWTADLPVHEVLTISCVDTSKSFTTPFGDFNCYVYEYYYENYGGDYREKITIREYYVPDLGLVGVEQFEHTGQSEILLKFTTLLKDTNVPIPK